MWQAIDLWSACRKTVVAQYVVKLLLVVMSSFSGPSAYGSPAVAPAVAPAASGGLYYTIVCHPNIVYYTILLPAAL